MNCVNYKLCCFAANTIDRSSGFDPLIPNRKRLAGKHARQDHPSLTQVQSKRVREEVCSKRSRIHAYIACVLMIDGLVALRLFARFQGWEE
jgi:hypothetical protein